MQEKMQLFKQMILRRYFKSILVFSLAPLAFLNHVWSDNLLDPFLNEQGSNTVLSDIDNGIQSIEICAALAEVASHLAINQEFKLAEGVFSYAYKECDEPLFLFQAGTLQVILSKGLEGFNTIEIAVSLMPEGEMKSAFIIELEALRKRYEQP